MGFKEQVKQIAENVAIATGVLELYDDKGRRLKKMPKEPAPRVNQYSVQYQQSRPRGPYRSRGVRITAKRPRITR